MTSAPLLAALLMAGAGAAAAPAKPAMTADPAATATLRVEVLLNERSARKAGMGRLSAPLALTPDRLILIEGEDRLYQVGWGGVRPVDGASGLDEFAYTDDGLFMAIRGSELAYLPPQGELKRLYALPSPGMGISAGRGKMLLFERRGEGGNGLYELFPGKKLLKILESPEPIGAAVESGDRLLFAAGGALFEVSPGRKMRALAILPGGRRILSLACPPESDTIYASDGTSVFSVADGRVRSITKEAGGALKWFDGGLIVFDARKPLVMRLVGLP